MIIYIGPKDRKEAHHQALKAAGLLTWGELMRRWESRGPCACGSKDLGPLLKDAVWRSISRFKAEIMCEPCMVRRLGRPLTEDDLKDVPWNYLRKVRRIV